MIIRPQPEPRGDKSGPQREQAYQRLRQMLILHQAPEGKRLNEEAWARRLQVNRAALREAFARLEAEGLIEKGVLPGYFVPKLSRDDIGEIVEVRIMLEGGAIDRICRLGLNTKENLQPLRDACDRLGELAREGDYAAVATADRAFHESLVSAAKNHRLEMLYQRAPLPIIPPEVACGDEWLQRVTQTLEEHRKIVDLIEAGNVAEAEAMLRLHLRERFHIPLRVV
ncbi:MAG TPA: GntR family transcriptional regulator [Phycisphaerae bacterium]|nr:GntR family transcriptional regulator [Phycisphaerae bacterium]HOJ75747.1 GntR family transcriptional regulator [Phycisphaerae bacterium]HOM51413.1 GntR family transcriptional regulator [Phycisphaerae bacterium]HON67454.1 GntR family transcriptional regulator [Phycisphaerae bacterium]HOQ87899.1 GntR family transcriptional regulator [Phycisphaerae bacterium]